VAPRYSIHLTGTYLTVHPEAGPVKTPRTYDSSGRRRAARQSRERILDVAQARFLSEGYVATTIASVAEGAGVSVDTVYKSFRGKAGLLRAIAERGLRGAGPESAEARSDRLQDRATPRTVMAGLGELTAEVAPRVAPMLLLLGRAAEHDPEIDELRAHFDHTRLERMRQNARRLHDRGILRPGIEVAEVADVFWTYSSPELYDLLVNRRGWSVERFGRFVGDALTAALL
jgi:AcrR family transcriptional regulator